MKYVIGKGSEAGKDVVRDFISGLDPAYPWSVEIKRHRRKKSNEQLGYYFGVLVRTICDETGNDSEDIHTLLCGEYFGWVDKEVLGRQRRTPARTLTSPDHLPRREMSMFIDWALAWAAREGFLITSPHEVVT